MLLLFAILLITAKKIFFIKFLTTFYINLLLSILLRLQNITITVKTCQSMNRKNKYIATEDDFF